MTLLRFETPMGVLSRPSSTWTPRVDVLERRGTLVVRAELPGMDAEAIDVSVEGTSLVLSGVRTLTDEADYHRAEIRRGAFRRTIHLPDQADPAEIDAVYHQGILEISIPKRPEVLPRRIKIEQGV